MATPVTSAPGGEGLGAAGPEVRGGVVVSAAGENVGDLVMGGKEALNLPRRLEPLHDPLSSSGRLMGVFGAVIEALVLPMLDPGHDLPLGSGVALQLVRDEHTRGSTLLLEELAEQALGGLLVAPALDENIENEAVLVDGTPEPMLFPGEADDDPHRDAICRHGEALADGCCQTASNRDPRSASKRDPSPALGQACPGSEQEGPARVAQCPHERRSGARGRA